MRSRQYLHKISTVAIVLLIGIVSVLPLTACSGNDPVTLTIFAAAGSKPALDRIASRYEEDHDVAIKITYAGAGEALSQIELTSSGDVFVAPEQSFMEKAAAKGVIDTSTVVVIAGMKPVIAVAEGNPLGITCLADLCADGIEVGVTRQETTLLGVFAPQIFEKAGLTDEIADNIITEAARPDNLLTALAMNQVDAGILWNFYGIQSADNVDIIEIPDEQLTGIGEMRAAVISFAENKDTAQDFVDYLTSAGSKTVFDSLGYLTD